MSSVRRHNPALQARLEAFLQAADYEGLYGMLNQLHATDFRTAGYLLGEVLLPVLTGDAYWEVFLAIVPRAPKAYLGTFLKAGRQLYEAGRLSVSGDVLRRFVEAGATDIDRKKTIDAFLPLLCTPGEAEGLLNAFDVEPGQRISYLLSAGSRPCCFLLFRQLKVMDDLSLIRRCCLALIRRGDRLSFNLASLLTHYFALEGIPGTFSLQLHPYEQGRLDASYEAFDKILTSI